LTLFAAVVVCASAQDSVPAAFTAKPMVRMGQYAMWHDPGPVETLDFRYGIGGPEMAPRPPFTFTEEDFSGSTPKVKVKDAAGRTWVIKFGDEASPDTFCTRLAWAMGYYVEPEYYVAEGTIEGVKSLQRARKEVDSAGRFHSGRFQLRSREPKYLKTVDWSWSDNPFQGTPELNGLKILMMLLSNWDDKDSRDEARRGGNTAIYQQGELYIYFIDDWGGAMGHWGKYFTRSKWNAKGFREQSADFVSMTGGGIHWGYTGQHTGLMIRDVKFGDMAWLMQYLGRVTDDQLRAGLLSSGATEEEAGLYVEALRSRIAQLQKVASQ
jgi:hypothetical protein